MKNSLYFSSSQVFLLLNLAGASQPSYSLRTTPRDEVERELSQTLFFTYEPDTKVTDHAAIDQDQKMIEVELSKKSPTGFLNAYNVYTNGANSKSYAILNLVAPSPRLMFAGDTVTGITVTGAAVGGVIMADVAMNSDQIKVQYETSDVASNHVACRVGGSPTPFTDGCFASSGSVTINGMDVYDYTYDVEVGNLNDRTLAGFSEEAEEKMQKCPNCPYLDFGKFLNYYGKPNYADLWIRAAFDQGRTDFSNGNADFSDYNEEGLAEVIQKGTAYMSVWMYVIREMEDALDDCRNDCLNCNDDPVTAWDEAVAFYHGSLTDSDNGYLLFTLANKRCQDFMTCGPNGDMQVGDAKVNIDIFAQFNEGKSNLNNGRCDDARRNKENIARLMAVPLIQGTIRYAYIQDKIGDKRDKARAEGATFAAAVLPLVHACSTSDAETIFRNMRVRSLVTDVATYRDVKQAFENVYECMNIRCADVGGIADRKGGYVAGTEPCGYNTQPELKLPDNVKPPSNGSNQRPMNGSNSAQANIGMAVGISAGLIVLAAFIVLMCCRTWKSGPIIHEGDHDKHLEGVDVGGTENVVS